MIDQSFQENKHAVGHFFGWLYVLSQKGASPKKKSFKDLFDLLDKNPSPVENYHYCREDAYDD